jgi:hypothetical protein
MRRLTIQIGAAIVLATVLALGASLSQAQDQPPAVDYGWAASHRSAAKVRVVRTDPADDATDVTVDAKIYAEFSADINAATLDTDTFQLTDTAEDKQVSGSVHYSSGQRLGWFQPDDSLLKGRQYQATVTENVWDLDGNRLAEEHTWTFTTETNLNLGIGDDGGGCWIDVCRPD